MVTTLKIYLGKDSGSSEHVQHVIKPWDREPILDGDFVDGVTFHTHSPGAIFLGCEKGGYRTWAFTHLNETLSHEFLDLSPKLSMFNWVETVMGKVG